jgi:hypothetical protein
MILGAALMPENERRLGVALIILGAALIIGAE